MSDTSSEETLRGETASGTPVISCTYIDCQERFASKEAMRNHKIEEPSHFYCKKCDVDCEDWASLTNHKVDMMAPFIEGRKRVRDEKPRHIVCEFCGSDFKSFDGRKTHRAKSHPADQDIDCPGCGQHFLRATHLIEHIERDACKEIRRWMLHACINHRYILTQVMEAPDQFQNALSASQNTSESFDPRGITDGSEGHDQEQGGVSLIDQDDDAQMGGYRAMQPEVNLMDFHTASTASSSADAQGSWPELPRGPRDLDSAMRQISISSNTTSHRKGIRMVTEPADGTVSNPWSDGSAAEKCFKTARPTPLAGDWKAIYDDQVAKASQNILNTHFWNPDDKSYSVDRFYDALLEAYCCPFPACRDEGSCVYTSYKTPTEVENHIREVHWIKMFRCPWCFRRFEKVAALMGHVENTNKCRVKESKDFEKFIADITGGFLMAESVNTPRILRFNKAIVKAGELNKVGVQSTKFSATLPMGGI